MKNLTFFEETFWVHFFPKVACFHFFLTNIVTQNGLQTNLLGLWVKVCNKSLSLVLLNVILSFSDCSIRHKMVTHMTNKDGCNTESWKTPLITSVSYWNWLSGSSSFFLWNISVRRNVTVCSQQCSSIWLPAPPECVWVYPFFVRSMILHKEIQKSLWRDCWKCSWLKGGGEF